MNLKTVYFFTSSILSKPHFNCVQHAVKNSDLSFNLQCEKMHSIMFGARASARRAIHKSFACAITQTTERAVLGSAFGILVLFEKKNGSILYVPAILLEHIQKP